MDDGIRNLEGEMHARGLSAYLQRPNQLVVSRQKRVPWPNRGNSFWVCMLAGYWHVCTWAPCYYRVPSEQPIADSCAAFVDGGREAQPRVPDDLITRFSLVETEGDDWNPL